ncbi:MAG: response regulator transcription factor, partial [Sphingobacteriales bacterium]
MNKRIHVVEDDEDIRYIIDFILKDSQFDVTLSPTATHFNEAIKGAQPDLILLDIMLPDGDGRD